MWVSAPVGGGMRVGSRVGGGGGGGGGGCGGLIAVMIVLGGIMAAVEWVIAKPWRIALTVLIILGIIRLVLYLREEHFRLQTMWQIGHRTEGDKYVVVIYRETGEELRIRSIPTNANEFSDKLSEARAEAQAKIDALEAHERREAEMQRA